MNGPAKREKDERRNPEPLGSGCSPYPSVKERNDDRS